MLECSRNTHADRSTFTSFFFRFWLSDKNILINIKRESHLRESSIQHVTCLVTPKALVALAWVFPLPPKTGRESALDVCQNLCNHLRVEFDFCIAFLISYGHRLPTSSRTSAWQLRHRKNGLILSVSLWIFQMWDYCLSIIWFVRYSKNSVKTGND